MFIFRGEIHITADAPESAEPAILRGDPEIPSLHRSDHRAEAVEEIPVSEVTSDIHICGEETGEIVSLFRAEIMIELVKPCQEPIES